MNSKILKRGIIGTVAVIALLVLNPFSYNNPNQCKVVTRMNGTRFIQSEPGIFYAGILSYEITWRY